MSICPLISSLLSSPLSIALSPFGGGKVRVTVKVIEWHRLDNDGRKDNDNKR